MQFFLRFFVFCFYFILIAKFWSQDYALWNELQKIDPKKHQNLQNSFKKFWDQRTPEELDLLLQISPILQQKRISFRPIQEQILDIFIVYEQKAWNKTFTLENWLSVFLEFLKTRNKNEIEKFLQKNYFFLQNALLYQDQDQEVSFSPTLLNFVYENQADSLKVWIDFQTTDLFLKTKQQQGKISKTQGKYFLLENRFEGREGLYHLARVGLDSTRYFLQLNHYNLQFRPIFFQAENAVFFQAFTNDSLLGSFKEKILNTALDCKKDFYPSFTSKGETILIKEVFPQSNIQYEGGIALICNRFYGENIGENSAKITFFKEENPYIQIETNKVEIQNHALLSEKVNFNLFLPEDTLQFIGPHFRYQHQAFVNDTLKNLKNKENQNQKIKSKNENLLAKPENNALEKTIILSQNSEKKLFLQSSYHQMKMFIDTLIYPLDSTRLMFKADRKRVNTQNPNLTSFLSLDYFDPRWYYSIENIADVHPFIQLEQMNNRFGNPFYIDDLAKFYKVNEKVLLPTLYRLKTLGYVEIKDNEVKILPMVFEYLTFIEKKKDYDALAIESNPNIYLGLMQVKERQRVLKDFLEHDELTDATTGFLDFSQQVLRIRGIQEFTVSKSRKITVFPKFFYIDLLKNRAFKTAGIYNVGNFNFYVDSARFDYENFRMDWEKIDSLKLNTYGFPKENGDENLAIYRIKNAIHELHGTLEIDDPHNRSGQFSDKKNNEYPIFSSLGTSIVYYQPEKNESILENLPDFVDTPNTEETQAEELMDLSSETENNLSLVPQTATSEPPEEDDEISSTANTQKLKNEDLETDDFFRRENLTAEAKKEGKKEAKKDKKSKENLTAEAKKDKKSKENLTAEAKKEGKKDKKSKENLTAEAKKEGKKDKKSKENLTADAKKEGKKDKKSKENLTADAKKEAKKDKKSKENLTTEAKKEGKKDKKSKKLIDNQELNVKKEEILKTPETEENLATQDQDNDVKKDEKEAEKFRIILEPFVLKKMNEFYPHQFAVPGTLETSGVFKTFPITVVIQPDYSLGTNVGLSASVEAYPELGNARYKGKVIVDSRGLVGTGILNVFTSEIRSDLFYFTKDSTLSNQAEIKNIGTAHPVSQPDFFSKKAQIVFYPPEKKLTIQTLDSLTMMNQKIYFSGQLTYHETEGLQGKGKVRFLDSLLSNAFPLMESDTFRFEQTKVFSDLNKFEIKSTGKKMSFRTEENRNHLDVGQSVDTIFPLKKQAWIDDLFYQLELEKATWDLKKNHLHLKLSDSLAYNFLSTHPEQDSLRFKAKTAEFDLKNKTLYAKNVESIQVADVQIIPFEEKLKLSSFRIDPLQNARLIFNKDSVLHEFYEVEVEIRNGSFYKGFGKITYPLSHKTQVLNVTKITTDSLKNSFAQGRIEKQDQFMLNSIFGFSGSFQIEARKKNWRFKGSSMIEQNCFGENAPFYFETEMDPLEEVQINLDPEKISKTPDLLGIGVVINDRNLEFYPSFLQTKKSLSHIDLFKAEGVLRYHETEKYYQIISKEKLKNENNAGKNLTFSPQTCIMNASGELNFGLQLNYLQLKTFGELQYQTQQNKLEIQSNLSVYFPGFQAKLSSLIAGIWEKDKRLQPFSAWVDYKKMIREILPKNEEHQKWTELSKSDIFSTKYFPEYFANSWIFTDLTWQFKKLGRYEGFVSNNLLQIPRLGKNKLAKRTAGAIFLSLSKQHLNDRIVILLLVKDADLYLDYQESEGILYIYSKKSTFLEKMKKEISKLKLPAQKNAPVPFQVIADLPDNHLYQNLEKYVYEDEENINFSSQNLTTEEEN